MKKSLILAALALSGFAATLPAQANGNFRARAIDTLRQDFVARGQAGLERVYEDALQAVCNRTGNHPSPENAKRLEAEQLASIKYPADGKLMGDWKKGEALAQSGRGFTWTDQPGLPVGGNCYNCHQISPKELAYGTVGPSLLHYGKLRGNSPEVQKYTYNKIYNAKAYNACSDMPRFGYVGALQPEQIRDLVALLLDPESPVNK